jgi:hypothetical protein
MVVIQTTNNKGLPIKFYSDGLLAKELDTAKIRVMNKNWDYVGLFCGLPRSGKSVLARTVAKYCCPWFDETYIAFTADEFVKITNECPKHSAVILDESFEALNTKVMMSPAFLKIVNHLQIVAQKNLFIMLCLPNFWDLSKFIAVFRSSHLFIPYASYDGDRGRFKAYGRDTKRFLYVKGMKYLDYEAVEPNFVGRFIKNDSIIDVPAYDERKKQHLLAQSNSQVKRVGDIGDINRVIDRALVLSIVKEKKYGKRVILHKDIALITGKSEDMICHSSQKLAREQERASEIASAMGVSL